MDIKVKSSILNRKETVITAAICILVIAMTILILKAMGRPLISNSGTVKLWHSEVVSSENSQHLSDWYSFSHIVHGFLFFFILWLVSKKIPRVRKFSIALVIAVVMESIWEIVENTDFIINRYREATIALDYFGDSITNSTADIFFMSLGFMMAARLSVIASLSIVVAFEVMLAFVIRDNLALNIIMLIYPIDAIKEWQLG
ncbi:MAG: hypothetical protein CMJ26_04120 [Phycisphaerae bacterium]|nr:hypothetical protein [Phycisphaerae bacterium]|tara:strand:+ start:95 stop:697 length:603 start_codon:yes stop_codon:yes gene_type:complete